MRVETATRVLRQDVTRLPPNPAAPYVLVFLDPPYGKTMGEAALTIALAQGWLAPDAVVVWEESAAPQAPAGLVQFDQRKYGDTIVTLLKATA
jgi:16S rRNA (guanine966-N2)-methyltransferase